MKNSDVDFSKDLCPDTVFHARSRKCSSSLTTCLRSQRLARRFRLQSLDHPLWWLSMVVPPRQQDSGYDRTNVSRELRDPWSPARPTPKHTEPLNGEHARRILGTQVPATFTALPDRTPLSKMDSGDVGARADGNSEKFAERDGIECGTTPPV